MPLTLTGTRHHLGSRLCRAMFEERKRVFVDLLGWNLPAGDDPCEIDQFDTPHTRYVICTTSGEDHLGSVRLLPTLRPCLLGALFPHLCETGAPQDPFTWEISRLCLSRRLDTRERRAVRDMLATTLVRFALDSGIRRYCCVASHSWLKGIHTFGWRCAPLGQPVLIDGRRVGALTIAIDSTTPALLAEVGTWRDGTSLADSAERPAVAVQ